MGILKKLSDLEKEASTFGFKWETSNQILEQIQSEISEIDAHLKDGNQKKLQEEIGDLLHAAFSLCVFSQFDVEETLLNSVNKFEHRFRAIQRLATEKGLDTLNGQSFNELMILWNKAKKLGYITSTTVDEKPLILTGESIQLEPLQQVHYDILKKLSYDEKISAYSPALKLKFDSWFNKALEKPPENKQISFIVRSLQDNSIVGSTRFYEMDVKHKRLAIGYTWIIPEIWGKGVNTQCKLLLLKYAFDVLLMNRVEFYVDARNERSRAAVKKLGAKEEGVLRKHMILEDGYVRDTVVYSILKEEWDFLIHK